jgi:hypothetical protein
MSTRVEQGQTEHKSCTCSGWLLSEIPLKTKGGLLLAHDLVSLVGDETLLTRFFHYVYYTFLQMNYVFYSYLDKYLQHNHL